MNHSFVPSSGRIAGVRLRLAIDLQASVDQLKRENATLSADVKRLNDQLNALGESMRRVEGTRAAPAEAWWALGVVGFTFVVAWGIVSGFRERVREQEADAERSRKSETTVAERAKMMEAAVDARSHSCSTC